MVGISISSRTLRRPLSAIAVLTLMAALSACGGDSSAATTPTKKKTKDAGASSADASSADASSSDRDAAAAGGLDAALPDASIKDATLTPVVIASSFTLAEGPIWDHCKQRLLFSDVAARTIHALDESDKLSTYFSPTLYANGLAFDLDGNLLLAEMGGSSSGRVSRLDHAKHVSVVVDKDPSGKPLGTTDDLVMRSDGTIYFTDPVFPYASFSMISLAARPIYRLKPGATKPVQEGTATGPNGIELSPDEKTLYVSAYLQGEVLKFSVAKDGSLTAEKPLITGLSNPDSLCLDAAGNVYVGVGTGLQVVAADGTKLKLIPISSSQGTTNCTFGGSDGKTLYVTAWKVLAKVPDMPFPGLDWRRNQALPCP